MITIILVEKEKSKKKKRKKNSRNESFDIKYKTGTKLTPFPLLPIMIIID